MLYQSQIRVQCACHLIAILCHDLVVGFFLSSSHPDHKTWSREIIDFSFFDQLANFCPNFHLIVALPIFCCHGQWTLAVVAEELLISNPGPCAVYGTPLVRAYKYFVSFSTCNPTLDQACPHWWTQSQFPSYWLTQSDTPSHAILLLACHYCT